MKKKRLIWYIYPSYVLLSALAMIAVAISASRIARSFHYERTEEDLASACFLLAEQLQDGSGIFPAPDIDTLCKTLAQKSGYRITVILPTGTVIGDSENEPASMENHGNREEIREAMTQGVGHKIRYSNTLREEMMYVAVPLTMDGVIKGIVRLSLSLAKIDKAIDRMWRQIALAGLIIVLIAMGVAVLISYRISRPLERIRQSVKSLGAGEFYKKLPSSEIYEVDVLAKTLNTMSDHLQVRIHTIQQQQEEQSALLSCMVESMLAVDEEKNLIRINKAAEELFRVKATPSLGKNIMEVIRNADLLELVRETLASCHPAEKEIYLPETGKYLQGYGGVLYGPDKQRAGAVIVINDITRLRKMERMRRDFVTNISHELKTPITSILGYTETLRTEAEEEKSSKKNFLDIIYKQSTRLQAIVEDLLALSSIEDDTEKGRIELREKNVDLVLQNAMQACQTAATKKNIQLEITCAPNLKANINLALLQRAVGNLVDNAVKYSDPGSKVDIIGEESEKEIAVHVRDQGPGIAEKHLTRLFERFYRIDEGRSRQLGGTGLGLALVKHIVIAHNGRVAVQSEYGKGSIFSIFLPKA